MLPEVRKTYVDGPFGQLHCRVAAPPDANRPAVVCLHMSPKSGRAFAAVLARLADERVALAPDYPGHGESDLPPAEPAVTIRDFAECTFRAVDALAAGPVHFVGHHTGAMVAVEAALLEPERVVSIVSLSAPVFESAELEPLAAAFEPIPIDEAGTRFRVMWERVLEHRGPGVTLEMAAASFAENLRAGDHYEWGHRAAFAYAPAYKRNLARIRQPVLVINPGDDCHDVSKRADALLGNGRRIDRPDWGHGFLEAFPREAAALILGFLRETETARGGAS